MSDVHAGYIIRIQCIKKKMGNGKVWEFDNLPDAVKKYNEVIQYGETEKIPE